MPAQEVPPPARGWSLIRALANGSRQGSPASAGMVPWNGALDLASAGFPRQRGDGPINGGAGVGLWQVPPPARGWSQVEPRHHAGEPGSPASAGMVPSWDGMKRKLRRFPRQRGDGPLARRHVHQAAVVPPPARGWS